MIDLIFSYAKVHIFVIIAEIKIRVYPPGSVSSAFYQQHADTADEADVRG